MRDRLLALLLAAWLPGAAAAQTPSDATALEAEEIHALFAGNTLYAETLLERFRDEPIRDFVIHLEADGDLTIRNLDGNTDTGRWQVTDEGLFCNQYRHTRRGMRKCYEVREAADGVYRMWDVEDGKYSMAFTIREGNPEAL